MSQLTLETARAQPLVRYRCGLCGVFMQAEISNIVYCKRGHLNVIEARF